MGVINNSSRYFDCDRKVVFNVQSTLLDHPNCISLIGYTRTCNFTCFGCHNMQHLKCQENLKGYSMNDLIHMLKDSFFDLFILSGGESTLNRDVYDMLDTIKQNTTIPIRIDSNGMCPNVINTLKKQKLIDGAAIDIKYPYWLGNSDELETIIGRSLNQDNIDSILSTIDIVDGMPYTLFRTVEYPILSKSHLGDIVTYMKKFKSPHYVNKFYQLQ